MTQVEITAIISALAGAVIMGVPWLIKWMRERHAISREDRESQAKIDVARLESEANIEQRRSEEARRDRGIINEELKQSLRDARREMKALRDDYNRIHNELRETEMRNAEQRIEITYLKSENEKQGHRIEQLGGDVRRLMDRPHQPPIED